MEKNWVATASFVEQFQASFQQLEPLSAHAFELQVESEDFDIDEKVFQSLTEVGLQALRNVFAHSGENKELRIRKNKPAAVQVQMRLGLWCGQLRFELEDDGVGLDYNRIIARAVQLGWLDPRLLPRVKPQDCSEFLFRPGFSLATDATPASLGGRGIGLDRVKKIAQDWSGACSLVPLKTMNENQKSGCIFTWIIPLPSLRSTSSLWRVEVIKKSKTYLGWAPLFLIEAEGEQSSRYSCFSPFYGDGKNDYTSAEVLSFFRNSALQQKCFHAVNNAVLGLYKKGNFPVSPSLKGESEANGVFFLAAESDVNQGDLEFLIDAGHLEKWSL